MKELTIEEKAKAYDEAYKRVAVRFGSNVANEIFPELKESEDEKIRKALIRYFTLSDEHAYYEACGVSYRDIVAWLEKQGEHKQHLELKAGKWYICYRAYCCRADHLTVKEGERFLCEKDGIVKGFVIKEPEKYFKEVCAPAPMEDEQKSEPEGNPDARKPTLRITKGKSYLCIKDYQDKNCTFTKGKIYESDKDGFLVDDEEKDTFERKIWEEDAIEYFSLFEKSESKAIATNGRQNPAWSEKDEKMFEHIIAKATLHFSSINYLDEEEINFLKSLKDRVQSQPKPEWSEEDETARNNIIAKLAILKSRAVDGGAEKEICEMEINWLKSLKEKCTWKPSDEQMSALSKAIAFVFDSNSDVKHSLESLYNELKKL